MADKEKVSGRSRSRARGTVPETTRRPGAQAAEAQAPLTGRGRVARGTGAIGGEVHVPVRPAKAAAEPLAGAIETLKIQGGGDGYRTTRGAAQRGKRFGEVQVRSRPPEVTDKTGKTGEIVRLQANYFKIESTPKWVINHYHVDFSPDIDNLKIRRTLIRVHQAKFGRYTFDGSALYTMIRLEKDEENLLSENEGSPVQVHIKFIREIAPSDPIVLQLLGIQMRKNLRHLNFVQVRRLYYDPQASKAIPQHNLELWPGFMTAIHQYETAPLLCADLTFKVLRVDTVLDQLKNLYKAGGNQRWRDDAGKKLIGSIVMTKYNNRTYRIDDIDFTSNPQKTFTLRDGASISFVDYYFQHYKITLKDTYQPLLISQPRKRDVQSGNTGPVILIPELCTMTGLDEATRSDYKIMKDVGDHTRASPSSRVECIKTLLNRINSNATIRQEMAEWNLAFSSDLVEFNGRVLPPETIRQDAGVQYSYNQATADWTKEMRNYRLLNPLSLQNWLVIVTPRDQENARNFLHALNRVGGPMGMKISQPEVICLNGDRVNEYLDALQRHQARNLDFVMLFLPNNRKDRYDAIKKHCCIDKPIPSQVMLAKTIMKPQMHMSVATKVAIQINCKLGGAPWCVPIPFKNAMVIGFDSYHDSSLRGRSVGAVCCSLDKDFTRYHSRAQFQTSHQELVNGLFSNIHAGLKRYNQINKSLPEKIFIYRDGVGEGQLNQIFDFEVQQVLDCIKKIGDYNPAVAFIVVTKRLNTRLFRVKSATFDNPLPGTVVDHEITRPEWYDFYLVSQSVRQGTVSPTHYNVIYDTTHIPPDILQKLTFRLTHLYYNWPGTLRVPAPCMYAHKLAFLTGQSLHGIPSQDLSDTLFYL